MSLFVFMACKHGFISAVERVSFYWKLARKLELANRESKVTN